MPISGNKMARASAGRLGPAIRSVCLAAALVCNGVAAPAAAMPGYSTFGVSREFDQLVALLGDDVLRDIVCRLSGGPHTPGRLSMALDVPEGHVLRRIDTLRRWGLVRLVRHDSRTSLIEPLLDGDRGTLRRWASKYCPLGDRCGAADGNDRGEEAAKDETIKVYRAEGRLPLVFDWLDSKQSFSFGHSPGLDRFRHGSLRAISEHVVKPRTGFKDRDQQDMEVLYIVLEGTLAHEDSAGHKAVVHPGEIVHMSAGKGVQYSELNPSDNQSLRFLEIWITPDRMGLAPSFDGMTFVEDHRWGRPLLIASGNGRDGSVKVNQDVDVYSALLDERQQLWFDLGNDRLGWVQVVRGAVTVNGKPLAAGDGAGISRESELLIASTSDGTEVLFFDMQ